MDVATLAAIQHRRFPT